MTDLASPELKVAELYIITLNNGIVARFTSHNANLNYGGNLYQAIPIKRSAIQYHTDLQVDKVEVEMGIVGISVGLKQYSIPQIIRYDFLRDSKIEIYAVNWDTLIDAVLLFEGNVTGTISYNQGTLSINCGSILDRLKDNFPKFIFSEFCQHQLYNQYCGVNKASYKEQSTVGASSTQLLIYSSIFAFSAHAEGYWGKGEIKFTGGNNQGLSRTVRKHYDGYVKILVPFSEPIEVGDEFEVWPGCDKSGATCNSKFGNYTNFFGFEYIPRPETMYG